MMNYIYKTDLSFGVSPTGDLERISGIENVREELLRRLITSPGTLVHRPEYGVGVKDYLNGINRLGNKRQLAIKIQEQFTQDPRVASLLGVQISEDPSNTHMVSIIIRVELIGFGEQSFTYQVGDLP